MSRITDALADLAQGRCSLDDVEALFREHRWRREPPTFEELMADADAEVERPVAYLTEVEAALSGGVITVDQYTRLASVVAEVVRSE